jgi:hypothetical protein
MVISSEKREVPYPKISGDTVTMTSSMSFSRANSVLMVGPPAQYGFGKTFFFQTV